MLQTDSSFLTLEPYLISIIIVVVSSIAAWLVNLLIKRYLHKQEGKKKSQTIDIVLKNLHPLYILIIIAGAWFAYKVLPFVTLPTFALYDQWIEGAFFVILVLLVCYVLVRVVKIFVDRYYLEKREEEKVPALIMPVMSAIVFVTGIMIILGYYNVPITPLITTFGIGGIVLALALQASLSNVFAGLNLVTDRPIKVGDYIEVDGTTISGYVHDIGWASTRVRTFNNVTIIVPNSKITTSTIFNYTTANPKYIVVSISVDYNQDLEKIEELVKNVAEEVLSVCDGGDTDRAPVIRFENLDATSITLKLWVYLEKLEAQFLIRSELVKAIKKKFDELGINFPPSFRKPK